MRFFTLLIILIAASSSSLLAQVDPLYAQYLNNPVVINPAYTGINKEFNAALTYRKQWAGFDGSPTTVSLTGHTSLFDNKMGLGLIIVQDKIGEKTNNFIQASYSYKLEFDDKTLSFGLQAGIVNFRDDLSDLNIYDQPDDVFSKNENTTKLNFGTGVILKSDKFFVGVSVPKLLKNTSSLDSITANLYTQHFYAMGSYVFYLSDRIRFKPSVLLKVVEASPLSADLNMLFTLDERFTGGVFTRNFNTYGLLAQMKLNQMLRFGYVFELPTNKSVGTKFTTHEILIGLNLGLFNFHDTGTINNF